MSSEAVARQIGRAARLVSRNSDNGFSLYVQLCVLFPSQSWAKPRLPIEGMRLIQAAQLIQTRLPGAAMFHLLLHLGSAMQITYSISNHIKGRDRVVISPETEGLL
eukprot:scaffold161308_cov55-Prasinocladus_malaysianus.AAC.1